MPLTKTVSRTRRFELVRKLKPKSIDRAIRQTSPRAARINLAKNAIETLNGIKSGKLTGMPESPKAIVEKTNDPKNPLRFYKKPIIGYLETLGYGEILRKRGLEASLFKYYRESERAARKK